MRLIRGQSRPYLSRPATLLLTRSYQRQVDENLAAVERLVSNRRSWAMDAAGGDAAVDGLRPPTARLENATRFPHHLGERGVLHSDYAQLNISADIRSRMLCAATLVTAR